MRMQENRSSKLFLMELIIAIFFFSVISAVSVQLFSEAYTRSVRSKELVQSVNLASNVAEYYRVWDWQEASWQEVFPEGIWQGENWQILYDEAWKPTEEEARYLLCMELVEQNGLKEAQIAVSERESGRIIYELTVKRRV